MTPTTIEIANELVTATVDPGQGSDVTSLVHRPSGVDVLFRSPWRDRADAIRGGHPAFSFDATNGWLERYRGGWQVLCPNAGDPRNVHGALVGFHGEASSIPWCLDYNKSDRLALHVELFSIPVRIDREISLQGAQLSIIDSLTNLSGVELEFDYSHHPAFGGAFLEGECLIESGATRFTSDPERSGAARPGSVHLWPEGITTAGEARDLREIAGPDEPMEVFGWLDGFSAPWATITNVDLNLTARLEWDGSHLPYAWLWQELNYTEQFPWFQRARAVAIEPSSTPTSGTGRRSTLRLGARQKTKIHVAVSLESGAGNV